MRGKRISLFGVFGLLLFGFAFVGLAGCGGIVADYELAYRHPSVRWVYRTGKELETLWYLPYLRQIHIHRLEVGSGCVVIEGGGPGCMSGWSSGYIATLDLETGRHTARKAIFRGHAEYVRLHWDRRTMRSTGSYRGVTLMIPMMSNEIHIGCSEDSNGKLTRVLRLRGSRSFSPSLYARRPANDVLVIGTFDGYVLCVDLKMLPDFPTSSSNKVRAFKESE